MFTSFIKNNYSKLSVLSNKKIDLVNSFIINWIVMSKKQNSRLLTKQNDFKLIIEVILSRSWVEI